MELGEPEKKTEKRNERRAMLDKRIEKARARHELARLGMGTIFLVIREYSLTRGNSMYRWFGNVIKVFCFIIGSTSISSDSGDPRNLLP